MAWTAKTRERYRPRGGAGYPSDLTDAQFALIAPLIPPPKPGGRPRAVDIRVVVNAILYLVRSGCQWRMLPKDFPPWRTVYDYFYKWRRDGVWDRIHDTLLRAVREQEGKEASPTAGIIDSQSVKLAEKGGPAASTPGKRSRAASDTSSSIPSA